MKMVVKPLPFTSTLQNLDESLEHASRESRICKQRDAL